jgi:hypothetical protein
MVRETTFFQGGAWWEKTEIELYIKQLQIQSHVGPAALEVPDSWV